MIYFNPQRFRSLLLLSAFFLFTNAAFPQLGDTISYSLRKKPKIFVMLASFNTFIDGQYANINGIRAGVNFNNRIRFGAGFFTLANNDIATTLQIQENGLDYSTSGQLYFSFASLSAEYFIYNRYPWLFGVMPVQFGVGGAKYGYIARPERVKKYTVKETVWIYQPEISAQYSIFKWLGVGASTGYRWALYRSDKMTKGLNGVSFAVDVRLFLDEVYKILFAEE